MARIRKIDVASLPIINEPFVWGSSVYVIREVIEDGDRGPLKVGIASHPMRRLCTHQVGNPRSLQFVAVYVGERETCRRVEREMLLFFRKDIIRGEWLSSTEEDVVAFLEAQANGEN